jgi:MFS transporter, DHA2 family, multidrug resistance protein
VDIKPLITLGGVLIAAMTSEFNDQVTVIALTDIRGALGNVCVGRDCRHGDLTLDGNDLTLWHSTLFAIVLCCTSSVLIRSAQTSRRYMLCGCCRDGWRHDYPSADETAFRVLTPSIRLYGVAVYALTTTFTSALAATVAALWTDSVDWRFVFLQTIPLCPPVGILVWSRSMGNDCPIPAFSSRSTPDGSSKAFPSVPSKTHVRILSLSSQDIVTI